MSIINKNTINSVSPNIRDFLLNKNLKPIYPNLLGRLPSPRIGEQVLSTSNGDNSVSIPNGLPLEEEGILNMELHVMQNKFQNKSSETNTLVSIENETAPQGPWGKTDYSIGTTSYPRTANDDTTSLGLMGKTNKIGFRDDSTDKNIYSDKSKRVDASDFLAYQPVTASKTVKGYLDEYGHLNLGGNQNTIGAINTIGSLINGQGIGFSKSGIVNNFDIRSSLAGRVLGATGVLNDTKLGMIGGQQLALSLANNAAFNVQQRLLGSLNVKDNLLSLVKTGGLAGFRPNYQITVPSKTLNKVLDTGARILGFTLPKSLLSDSGSIFQSESGGDIDNVTRTNNMILNTGSGQVISLLKNATANLNGTSTSGYDSPSGTAFRSGYSPSYTNNDGEAQINGNNIYAYSKDGILDNLLSSIDGIIPNINNNREASLAKAGFRSPEMDYLGPVGNPGYGESNINNPGFTWTSGNAESVNNIENHSQLVGDKKSLLVKTQKLFNSAGMLNIVTKKGDMNKTATQIQTAVVGGGISKGNAVMKSDVFLDNGVWDGRLDRSAENTYCRSWTTLDRYDKVNKMVRSRGIDESVPYRFRTENSVLEDNGMPKIAPYRNDGVDVKKYMFSIENLAWSDNVTDLLPSEQGAGDLISGKKGRVMWFPPYEIQFNEMNSVNWESNNFIGRGESVYTYNNTERSGTLSFKVIVDHASYVNGFSGAKGSVVDDHYVASFFAGCVDPSKTFSDKLTTTDINSIENELLYQAEVKAVTKESVPPSFNVYFPNDNAQIPYNYENGLSGITSTQHINYEVYDAGYGIGPYPSKFTKGVTRNWNDNHNYGLNAGVTKHGGDLIKLDGDDIEYKGWLDYRLLTGISKFIDAKCPNCVVTVTGYASVQGVTASNNKLGKARAEYIVAEMKKTLFPNLTEAEKNKRFKAIGSGESNIAGCVVATKENPEPPTDTIFCKIARKVTVTFKSDTSLAGEALAPKPTAKSITQRKKTVTNRIINKLYNEQDYFEKLNREDSFVFDKFRDKIKYFHPGFHSTTPEGLNSRLTFLLQCTRQGPTIGQGANNLAFGRPPVCILRIGDFYNTKIIMDSVNIDYEPLVWDLNPEGIGVQPMIANVSISFKFIGGSSLMGPINKLQNALSFNYFANTQVYDPRADYIAKNKPMVSTGVKTKSTPPTETTTNYSINNDLAPNGNMNKFKGNSNETFTTTQDFKFDADVADKLVNDESKSFDVNGNPITNKEIKISGISCDEKKTVKLKSNWQLNVKFNVTNGTNDPKVDALSLSQNGDVYSLRITDVNSNETYQEIMNVIGLESALTPNSDSGNFLVPLKNSKNDTGEGIVDSFGKEKFMLEVLVNNKSIKKINIKIK